MSTGLDGARQLGLSLAWTVVSLSFVFVRGKMFGFTEVSQGDKIGLRLKRSLRNDRDMSSNPAGTRNEKAGIG